MEPQARIADDYAALLGRLFAARRFGAVLELSRMVDILEALGHPERRVGTVVHIGGTNGKGSTTAFVEALGKTAGLRVAAFSSPHLSHLAERFRVGQEPLSRDEIVAAAARVESADGADQLTFFERITAMALCAFERRDVQLCVLEVGLGGRFDATNAVGGDVAVVTGVALDHAEHLGGTLEAIAFEKAGIFRAGRPAIIGRSGEPEVVATLERLAIERGCDPVQVIGDPDLDELRAVSLGLPGTYQRANAAAAVAACRAARVAVDVANLARARLPGRLERVAEDPVIVVDGAHNGHAARTLVAELPDAPVIAVIGVSAGKDVESIVAPLAARARSVVATRSRQDRSAEPDAVVAVVPPTVPVCREPSVSAAIARARSMARAGDLIVVAGSLFVAAEAREHVLGVVPDPVPLSDPAAIS